MKKRGDMQVYLVKVVQDDGYSEPTTHIDVGFMSLESAQSYADNKNNEIKKLMKAGDGSNYSQIYPYYYASLIPIEIKE